MATVNSSVSTNKKSMELNQKIRSVIPWVISNYKNKSDQCRKVMNCIIEELDTDKNSYAIVKLYINYYLCELIINYVNEDEVHNFLITVFPTPLEPLTKNFLEQLLSLSVCLNNKQILNALTFYIENNEIKVNENEIKSFPADLAINCPVFVSTLINKKVFFENEHSPIYTTSLLSAWLTGLNLHDNNKQIKINSEPLIEFVLKNKEDRSSNLHYNLLELIQKQLVTSLSIEFFTNLLNHKDLHVEKYAQILIVALQNACIDGLNDKTKNALIKKLPSNSLLVTFLKAV